MRHSMQLLALPLATILAIPLLAQDVPELTEGQRLRLRAPGVVHGRMQGTFVAWQADTLLLRGMQRRDTVTRVPRGAIERLEIGDRRSRGAGALRGLWIGALTGALFGGITGFLHGESGEFDRGGNTALGAAVFLTAGVVIGPLFGAISPGHRWTTVQLPAQVGLVPLRDGAVGVAVSIRSH